MRIPLSRFLVIGLLGVFACGDDDDGPTNGGDGNGDGNGDGDGEVGAVTVGDIFFQSDRNGTINPAIDTVGVGGTVTWTWTNTGATPHSVRSEGSPSFASSATLTGNGQTYSLAFTEPGTYEYDCAVHGDAMTGRVVVE